MYISIYIYVCICLQVSSQDFSTFCFFWYLSKQTLHWCGDASRDFFAPSFESFFCIIVDCLPASPITCYISLSTRSWCLKAVWKPSPPNLNYVRRRVLGERNAHPLYSTGRLPQRCRSISLDANSVSMFRNSSPTHGFWQKHTENA